MLEGHDLVKLARKHTVTIWKTVDGKKTKNKGWAGHTIERYLGLPLNSTQSPNFGSWELKVVPLKRLKSGRVAPKETMAVTMIDAVNVRETPFEKSHLFAKLKKAVICTRMFESVEERKSKFVGVTAFDLGHEEVFRQIRKDYEDVRATIKKGGFSKLTGKMGVLVQPRTKGAGHGSTSRAFYVRTGLLKIILGLEDKS